MEKKLRERGKTRKYGWDSAPAPSAKGDHPPWNPQKEEEKKRPPEESAARQKSSIWFESR